VTHLSGIIERLDLDAIEARANAATPGPWLNADKKDIGKDWLIGSVIDCGTTLELSDRIVTTDRLSGLNVTSGGAHEDAEFIAHARTDIPALIAEIRALRSRSHKAEG